MLLLLYCFQLDTMIQMLQLEAVGVTLLVGTTAVHSSHVFIESLRQYLCAVRPYVRLVGHHPFVCSDTELPGKRSSIIFGPITSNSNRRWSPFCFLLCLLYYVNTVACLSVRGIVSTVCSEDTA